MLGTDPTHAVQQCARHGSDRSAAREDVKSLTTATGVLYIRTVDRTPFAWALIKEVEMADRTRDKDSEVARFSMVVRGSRRNDANLQFQKHGAAFNYVKNNQIIIRIK